jgi:hypothetical protein
VAWRESVASEVLEIVESIARDKETISYSELAGRISTEPPPEPNSEALAEILDEISKASDAAGRGMLSAVVVHKDDGLPGTGFFGLARRLGREVPDKAVFHVTELSRVYEAFDG